ncbi:peptide ABC transporter substrate-binding protein [Microbulbifer guangxiensis]|uniref:peptide ABC transporter substrate-binding protein n=1 Tax=Microbulbifer guangxiensis TaxID=2904249 RepID=UPI001F279808|nr:peptide ABC transporter substrate-binding protein [Microbulbifer guangxiensis]
MQALVRANDAEPQSLDPHKMGIAYEATIIQDLLEGLVTMSADGSVVPATADRWEHDDGLAYRFYLRTDARWSNGDPVTAWDFVYAWQRAADPQTASYCAEGFRNTGIQYAASIIRGDIPPAQLGVVAIDAHTLQVRLEKPLPYFPKLLHSPCFAPLHKETIEAHGEQWARPESYVGNGPFVLAEWSVNEKVVLSRNRHYWDNANVRLENVTFLPITSDKVELDRYRAGEVDVTSGIPDAALPELMRQASNEVVVHPRLTTLGIEFNTHKPPLTSPLLRQALSYALDRDVIANKVYGIGNRPAYSFNSAELPDFIPPTVPSTDLAQEQREQYARKLLQEALSEQPASNLRLIYINADTNAKFALSAAAMWKKILGLEVELQGLEWKAFDSESASDKFDMRIMGYNAWYSDPSAVLSQFIAEQTARSGYHSEQIRSLMESARSMQESAERAVVYTEIERILAEDAPFIPVVHRAYPRLVKPHVRGFTPSPFGQPYSKDLWIATNTPLTEQEARPDE